MRFLNHVSLFSVLLAGIFACAPVRRESQSGVADADPHAGGEVLDVKLDKQWERYEQAREYLLRKVVTEGQTVARDEWETQLALTGDYAFGPQDIAALRERHAALVAANQIRAANASSLDLDRLRQGGDVAKFCHGLPKGGMLHIHPWGTLDRQTVKKILKDVNPVVPFAKFGETLNAPGETGTVYPEELDSIAAAAARYPTPTKYKALEPQDQELVQSLFFLPPGNHDFDRFTAVFTSISALVFANKFVDAEPTQWEAFLTRAKEHNVRYVEVSRFVVPKPTWFETLEAWTQDMEDRYGVVVRLHAAFARNKDAAFTRTKVDQLLTFPQSRALVGVNILADETAYPALENGQTLYAPVLAADLADTSSLHRTAHAGELGDPRNVRDMMIMGAERVGHGVKLMDDAIALEYARTKAFPIEINLVSNRRLKVVEDLSKHPFLHYLRLGLKVSFSTDDEGIFESTIDDECVAAITETDINYDELRRTSFNSIETSFADPATKAMLLEALQDDFETFETGWPNLRP